MPQTLSVYIPMDRRHALAQSIDLPQYTTGTALFAGISGFTPLTEALARALGPRHGAEELTRQLNRVYDALITEIHRYRGSVLGFAGDAITCWFADSLDVSALTSAALRAVTCAEALQRAMLPFVTFALPTGETASLAGLGEFLTELRPAVTLFLRFQGINYNNDADASPKLDTYIRWVQSVLTRYEGSLLQLIVDDKGNYLSTGKSSMQSPESSQHRLLSLGYYE